VDARRGDSRDRRSIGGDHIWGKGTSSRATANGATWGGYRASFAFFGRRPGTSTRATAIGTLWGDIRAGTRPRATAIGATWGGIGCPQRGVHLWGNNRGCHGVFWKGQRHLCQSRAETRPRATTVGATRGGIRARFRTRSTKASRGRCSKGGFQKWGNTRGCHRVFWKGPRQWGQARAGTGPRVTAIGAIRGGIRAIIALFGYQAGTSPRATAIGAYWGDFRRGSTNGETTGVVTGSSERVKGN